MVETHLARLCQAYPRLRLLTGFSPNIFDKVTGVAGNKIVDRELLEPFETISSMSEDEKYGVKKMLEGGIVKHQVEKVMRPKVDTGWSERFREFTAKLAQRAKDYSQDEIDSVIHEAVAAVIPMLQKPEGFRAKTPRVPP